MSDKVACKYCGKEYSPKGIKAHENSCSHKPRGEMKIITY